MGMRISLDLSDRDLRFFRDALSKARLALRDAEEVEIVEAIGDVLAEIKSEEPLPDFVSRRVPQLESMLRMLQDDEWRLPPEERERVLATFIYFGDPEDILPDHIPVIGYLDDVIMIELVVRELRHEIEAYADFCEYRQRKGPGGKNDKSPDATREEWLAARRNELQSRMRRRRKRNDRSPASRSPRVL